jgi:uncharacterized protein YdeI (YjbR/CyaY-like superfamily)
MNTSSDIPILEFSTAQQWRDWLKDNYTNTEGIWLRLYKKNTGIPSINHAEALDQALCFGWIDGQGKKLDEKSWIIKFTPRRTKSMWSKRNRINVERLIQEKQMTEHGLKEIERAKQDGRWEAAYDAPKDMVIPDDFLQILAQDKEAEKFFNTLNKVNTYAIAWRLQTAKNPDIRKKRINAIVTMMKEGKKFH